MSSPRPIPRPSHILHPRTEDHVRSRKARLLKLCAQAADEAARSSTSTPTTPTSIRKAPRTVSVSASTPDSASHVLRKNGSPLGTRDLKEKYTRTTPCRSPLSAPSPCSVSATPTAHPARAPPLRLAVAGTRKPHVHAVRNTVDETGTSGAMTVVASVSPGSSACTRVSSALSCEAAADGCADTGSWRGRHEAVNDSKCVWRRTAAFGAGAITAIKSEVGEMSAVSFGSSEDARTGRIMPVGTSDQTARRLDFQSPSRAAKRAARLIELAAPPVAGGTDNEAVNVRKGAAGNSAGSSAESSLSRDELSSVISEDDAAATRVWDLGKALPIDAVCEFDVGPSCSSSWTSDSSTAMTTTTRKMVRGAAGAAGAVIMAVLMRWICAAMERARRLLGEWGV